MKPYAPTLPCKPGQTMWLVRASDAWGAPCATCGERKLGRTWHVQRVITRLWTVLPGGIAVAYVSPAEDEEDTGRGWAVDDWQLYPTKRLAEAKCRSLNAKGAGGE